MLLFSWLSEGGIQIDTIADEKLRSYISFVTSLTSALGGQDKFDNELKYAGKFFPLEARIEYLLGGKIRQKNTRARCYFFIHIITLLIITIGNT